MRALVLFTLMFSFSTLASAAPRRVAVASPALQEKAAAIRAAGDDLFIAGSFESALDHYRRGLALWEHPTLHFSAGLCALELRDWLTAIASFEAALAFDDGLSGDDRAEANRYLETARAKTAMLDLVSTQGAELFVDGTRASRNDVRVLAGTHVVTARRGGIEASETVHVAMGERRAVRPLLHVDEVRPRWSRWKPWTVLVTGTLVAAAAIPLYGRMYERAERAEQSAAGCFGCDGREYDALRAESASYRRYGTIALGVGGAIAVTGIILVAANTTVHERRPLPVVALAPSGITLGLTSAW
ncbi:MAG: hypothetical protein ACKV2T_11575 [Kofleriaceae bacterium]